MKMDMLRNSGFTEMHKKEGHVYQKNKKEGHEMCNVNNFLEEKEILFLFLINRWILICDM